jgi:hypothetical protein
MPAAAEPAERSRRCRLLLPLPTAGALTTAKAYMLHDMYAGCMLLPAAVALCPGARAAAYRQLQLRGEGAA